MTGEDHDIYEPYRGEVEVKSVRTTLRPFDLFPKIRELEKAAEGDVIYAFKPLVTSFAPAYYAARIADHRPLLLDVEDEEVYGDQIRGAYDAWRKLGRGWNLGISWKYTRLLQLLRRSVDAVTAVSTVLQRRYGGTLLRHGPDEDRFDPNRNFGSKSQLRKKWGLPEKKKLTVFIGAPCSHKELDTLADALSRPSLEEWAFVLVGPHENEFVNPLREKVPERSYFLGPQKYDYAPEFLHLADAIPIPKKNLLRRSAGPRKTAGCDGDGPSDCGISHRRSARHSRARRARMARQARGFEVVGSSPFGNCRTPGGST